MFTLNHKSTLTRSILAAAVLFSAVAAAPQQAEAGRTGYFLGGLAAGVAGLLAVNTLLAPRRSYYAPRYYAPVRRYYKPAPRVRAPEPVCSPVDTILRNLTNKGYYNFRKEVYGDKHIFVTAHKRGSDYRLKVKSCSGRLVSSSRI